MSRLKVYPNNSTEKEFSTSEFEQIQIELNRIGVKFDRWDASRPIDEKSSNEEILEAYSEEIKKLAELGGYTTWDVISLAADHPQKDELRKKFLDEHTHSEDEVRFFVRGSGLFTLHKDEKVYMVMCEKDDLISVPAGTTHWFDMGANPNFTAIRMFNNPEGWVANFTGNDIAKNYPSYEQYIAE